MLKISSMRKMNQFILSFLHILGLKICANIIVGDAMIRGISVGQKKRITTDKSNKKKKRLD